MLLFWRTRRFIRKSLLVLCTSGVAFGIATECNPDIRATIFGGFQALATSFLDAFFIKIQEVDDGIVTVEAPPPTRSAFEA